MHSDTPVTITYICDADLRRVKGFQKLAKSITVGDIMAMSAEYEKRKAAMQGDSSKNQN